MQWKNTSLHYGAATKFFHWAVFFLLLYQYVVAMNMTRMTQGATALGGFDQNTLYNWHKSVGIVLLILVFARYMWRRTNPLPDWAPTLSPRERQAVHWIERVLYICMFVMPLSGILYVMAGGYGVLFFGRWPLPNFLGENETLALVGQWTHKATAYVLFFAWLAHIGLVLKHQFVDKDRLLNRMLPFTHQ